MTRSFIMPAFVIKTHPKKIVSIYLNNRDLSIKRRLDKQVRDKERRGQVTLFRFV